MLRTGLQIRGAALESSVPHLENTVIIQRLGDLNRLV